MCETSYLTHYLVARLKFSWQQQQSVDGVENADIVFYVIANDPSIISRTRPSRSSRSSEGVKWGLGVKLLAGLTSGLATCCPSRRAEDACWLLQPEPVDDLASTCCATLDAAVRITHVPMGKRPLDVRGVEALESASRPLSPKRSRGPPPPPSLLLCFHSNVSKPFRPRASEWRSLLCVTICWLVVVVVLFFQVKVPHQTRA